ncbi:MAG: rhomboid family intramembrane serine protease [Planctomycetota bacterium]
MLIPLGTERSLRRPSLVSPLLVVACVMTHIGLALVAASSGEDVRDDIVSSLWVVGGPDFRWWTLFTSAFLHGGFLHLAGNMLFLWVFGPLVEDKLGRLPFLAFYLAGAAAASGLHAAFEFVEVAPGFRQYIPAVGASGAIAAVTGACLVFFPMVPVRVLLFLIIIGRYSLPAWIFIALQLFWNFIGMAGIGARDVAYLAHLGGYGFGFIIAFGLLATKLVQREPYDLFTIGRQAQRRRALKEASRIGKLRMERAMSPDAKPDKAAQARTTIANCVSVGEHGQAADRYLALLEEFGDDPKKVTLSRAALSAVGDELYRREDHSNAAIAYRRLLDAYPDDRQAATTSLMLGLLFARYLNDPKQAEPLLRRAAERAGDADERALAAEVLQELGVTPTEDVQ